MNSRTKLLRACCAALVVFAAGPAASAYLPVPFDEAALASMHSVGIVEGPEPDECNVYVYTSAFGGGSFRSDIESLSRIREFSPLVGVAQGGLQAGLAEALARTLGRERAASPALALRMLPRPASTRGQIGRAHV